MGEKIKHLRISRHLSQRELATLLDVSKSTLAAYENDSRTPSYEVLARIAEIFHVTTDYLILGNRDIPTINVTGLSREQIYHVISMVEGLQATNLIKDIVSGNITTSYLHIQNEQTFGKDNKKMKDLMDKLIDMARQS